MRLTKPRLLAVITGLMLFFWASRLIALEVFPPFVDEVFHIDFARQVVDEGILAHSDEGRQLTIWWFTLFQPYSNSAAVYVARIATLLAVLPGFAAAMAIGRLLAGQWGALLAGLLYSFSTYHMFFERMALTDPVSNALVIVAVAITCRLTRRVSLTDALLVGGLLAAAFIAKVSALPYLAIPVAAVLLIRLPAATSWRVRLQWVGVALFTAITISAAFVLVARWRGYDVFFYLLRGTGEGDFFATLASRIPVNIGSTFTNVGGFVGVVGLILLLILAVIAVWRKQFFLPAIALLPLLIYWLNNRPDTRHMMTPVTLLLICAAVVVGGWMLRWPPRWQGTFLTGVIALGLVIWLPFALAADRNPLDLQVPDNDYQQYLTSESSGTGLNEIIAELEGRQPQQVIGIFANCLSLYYITLDQLPVSCPHLNPNGDDREALSQLLEESQQNGVFAVLETIDYVPAMAPGAVIREIIRPNGPSLIVYDLAPAAP